MKSDFFHRHERKIVILLLCIFAVQVLNEIFTYFETYDERGNINAGYQYLKTGETNIGPANPILPRILNALPGLIYYNTNPPTQWGDNPFGPNFKTVLIISRIKTLIFGIILGILVYLLAKKLFGIDAALLALFFYAFEPNILAHSSLATTDILITFFIFVSVICFYKFLLVPSIKSSIIAGITLGLALISKFTAILLIPAFFLLAIRFCGTRSKKQYCGLFAIILISSLFVINVAYLFKGTFVPLEAQGLQSNLFTKLPEFLKKMPALLPTNYLRALDYVQGPHADFPTAYLFGRYSEKGFWYYYIVAFFIKTPIPLILCIIIGLILLSRDKKINELLILLSPVVVFFIFFMFFSHKNIGLRYILPVYPFLIIVAGTSINWLRKKKILLYFFCASYVLSAWMIAPNHIAYFNEFVGGPSNGYKYLIDSNLDWGQGEMMVWHYMNRAGVPVIKNPGCEYTPGRIVVGANFLADLFTENKQCHEWLRNFTPITHVGYANLVYEVPERTNETKINATSE